MASPTSIPSNSNSDPIPAEKAQESAFAMQWQPTDTTSLQPTHLHLTRVPRAWERKPLSPFSRQKKRVGKVWKRAAPVEIRQRKVAGGGKEGKMVKKMRLDVGGGVSVASAARWEGEEGADGVDRSPVRKIVLRRDRVGEEGLAALSEVDEDVGEGEQEEEAIVEVFDEEGTLLDVSPEDVEDQEEWQDEEEFIPTMMHLGDLIRDAQQQQAGAKDVQTSSEQEEDDAMQQSLGEENTENVAPVIEEPVEAAMPEEDNLPQLPVSAPTEVILPEGFVSPVKQQAPPARRSTRKSLGSRRRTLPTEWRPSRLRQVENAYAEESEGDDGATALVEPVLAQVEALEDEEVPTLPEIAEQAEEQDADQEWEDIENEPPAELDAAMDDTPADEDFAEDVDSTRSQSDSQQAAAVETCELAMDSTEGVTADFVPPASPIKLPSSPAPSIEGQHPRLPLRRSPRRKSSSPVKRSTIQPSVEKSHLVAFTPIKGFQPFSDSAVSPIPGGESTEEEAQQPTPRMLERSVSAPPEEPKMSPHRPSRPRVSDDTALLQAFLNRAAETKSSGRRISTSKRESMTNRRDSDAVRQALASPAKPEVLADLDPNSPSPRKATIASDEIDDANILPEPEPEASPQHKTRRSGRATRKAVAQTATPAAAPNKISIRGNSENVVLKNTEAQELSKATRTNTRKNKGTAVLPLYRLAKLQQQGVVDPLDDGSVAASDEVVSKPNSKGRALRWNETLVEFWQGRDVSETSILSDELSSAGPAPSDEDKMEVEAELPAPVAAGPPPPAETPSKPKIRRLKAPRTAATPGKAASTPIRDENTEADSKATRDEAPAEQAKASASTKRRSRIATPAKSLSNSSLLPADLEPTPAPAPAAQPQQQPTKKSIPTPSSTTSAPGRRKAPASKLPAPASASAAPTTNNPLSSSTTSVSALTLGQGKENQQSLLISSPPKKKPGLSLPPPAAKTFAPKLDFGKSFAPPTSQEDGTMPGLASPAKKVGRKGVMFAPATSGSQEESKEEVPMGLRSPAKKRTRRAVGGH